MSKITSKIKWEWRHFKALELQEMYAIFALRIAVFVVEQNCPYQDADGKDLDAFHLYGTVDNRIVAYSRILPPGVSYAEVSIGRVIIDSAFRSKGWGQLLMAETMTQIEQQFGAVPVRISAQVYLINYYKAFGFEVVGESYLEDFIPHIQMLYSP